MPKAARCVIRTPHPQAQRLIAALRHGILLLMFPPLLIFAGIIGLAYNRRDTFAEYPEADVNPNAPVEENHEVEIPLYD